MWGTQKDIILIFIPLLGGTGRLNSSGKTEADPEVETWKYDAYWIAHCGLLCMTCWDCFFSYIQEPLSKDIAAFSAQDIPTGKYDEAFSQLIFPIPKWLNCITIKAQIEFYQYE